MEKKNLVRIAALAAALVMLFTLVSPIFTKATAPTDSSSSSAAAASSDSTAALKEKLNNLNQQLEEHQNLLEQIKEQRSEAKSTVVQNQTQLNTTKQKIGTMQSAIYKKQQEIEQKQKEIEDKQQQYKSSEDLFMSRLRALYMMRGGDEIATLLAVNSFSEFLTASDTLQRISKADTNLLETLEAQRKEIEVAKAKLDADVRQLGQQQKALETQRTQYVQALKTAQQNEQAIAVKQQDEEKQIAEIQAMKAAITAQFKGSTGKFVGTGWTWPVPGYPTVTSGFGERRVFGRWVDIHTGIDISGAGINLKPIVAANAGTVIRSGWSGYGNYIIIDHGGGIYTLYGHCASRVAQVGDVVASGQTIAYVGTTYGPGGYSTGPHLHFEVRQGSTPVNPRAYVG